MSVLALSFFFSIITFWTPRYLAFQDHPSHLAREHALISYGKAGSDAALYYLPNLGLIPNQLSDLVIVGLGRLFRVPVDTASRLFFTLYALALPAALLWFLRVFNPKAPEYVLLAPLLTLNYFLLMGNENFAAGIPLFLALLAQWAGGWSGRRWQAWAGGACLATLLYFCHMVAFGSAAVVVGTATLLTTRPWRERLAQLSVFLPGTVLFVLYAVGLGRAASESDTQITSIAPFASVAAWAGALADGVMPGVFSDKNWASWVFGIAAAVLVVAGLSMRWRSLPRPFLAGVLLLSTVAAALPEWAGVWRPGQRIALLGFLALTAVFPTNRSWRLGFSIVLVPLLLVLRRHEYETLSNDSNLVADAVAPFQNVPLPRERGGTVYPVVTEPYVSARALHRIYEYYHLQHGGVSPFQIIASDYSLKYRDYLADPAGLYSSPEMPWHEVANFDVVLLIGKDGEMGPEWKKELERRGWVERSGNPLTGVFTRSR